jgi:proteasome lid subunit RPN8/RPN11
MREGMPPPPLSRLLVPQPFYDVMLIQALMEMPLECCGLLAGKIGPDGTGLVEEGYPLVNAAASPVEYLSEPRGMFTACRDMRRRGLDILAVYHSHPSSPPVPSRKDLAQNYDPGVVNVIISLASEEPHVRAWWLAEDRYREAEWVVVPDGVAE